MLRFETILVLGDFGVGPERLRAEVRDPTLAGGKLDLVVDPPRGAVIEFKFPRDSSTGISPDTMTMGELLRDFFRVAAIPTEDRWVVQLLNARLARYLETALQRYGLQWTDQPGLPFQLAPTAIQALPGTARRALGDVVVAGGVSATCEVREQVGTDLTLLGYRVDPLWPETQAPVPLDPAPILRPPNQQPPETRLQDREGARREILEAARAVTARSGRPEFTMPDVIAEMRRRGTSYAVATIRTMISSHLCAESVGDGVAGYADLTRVGRGTYRLK